jgi:Flp pilus assembly protein TadG
MKRKTLFAGLNNPQGSVAVIVALLLVVLIGFIALALDVGYMMVKRNELQNVADSAALAATRKLGAIYKSLPYSEQLSYVASPADIDTPAMAMGTSMGLTINTTDVIIGHWDSTTNTFTAGLTHPNAVRVNTRRDNSANGPVTTFFAGVLGINSAAISNSATASLTPLGVVPPCGLPLPVGISMYKFSSPTYCNTPIRLNPTNDPTSCAGWNVYTESPANNITLRNLLNDSANGKCVSPEDTVAGETEFNFIGGNLGQQAFTAMQNLFDKMRVLNDGILDKDTDSSTWTTTVPVYDWPDCSNPNPRGGSIPIVAFATIKITNVAGPPAMTIDAEIVCDIVTSGPGGGPGGPDTWGDIPNLVE